MEGRVDWRCDAGAAMPALQKSPHKLRQADPAGTGLQGMEFERMIGKANRQTTARRRIAGVRLLGPSLLPGLLLLLSALLLTACGDPGNARVRVVQSAPAAGTVDAYASDDQIASQLFYGNGGTYTQVTAASHTISVTPYQKGSDVLVKAVQTFVVNTDSSVFLFVPGGTLTEGLALDDNSAPSSAGNFKLRLVQASPTAANVDLYVTLPSTPIATVTPTFANVPYETIGACSAATAGSTDCYLDLVAGSYQILATTAGTKTIVADSGAITFDGNTVNTAVIGDATGGGLPGSVFALQDANLNTPPTTMGAAAKR